MLISVAKVHHCDITSRPWGHSRGNHHKVRHGRLGTNFGLYMPGEDVEKAAGEALARHDLGRHLVLPGLA